MTLAQKRMASMIMENTAADVEAYKASQEASSNAARAARPDAEMEMVDEEDEVRIASRRREEEEFARAKALQAKSLDTGGPMKIRENYVPKSEQTDLRMSVISLTYRK